MLKRLGAVALAAASTASVLALAAAPADAATPCGTYPPGQGYTLQRAPYSAKLKTGTTIGTRGTLRRGGQPCVGYRLGLYTKPASQAGYRLAGSGVTGDTGSVRLSITVRQTTRFFYNLNVGGGVNVRSGITEFIAV